MMARTSCSATSNDTSCSAFTPPKASETFSTESIAFRRPCPSRRPFRRGRREGLCLVYAQIGRESAGPAVLVLHLRFDMYAFFSCIQGIHQRGVFLADEAAAHLARARQLAVVRIELLVQ